MKPTTTLRRFLCIATSATSPTARLAFLAFAASPLLPFGTAGAQTVYQWNGTTDAAFITPTNWTAPNGLAPTTGDTNSRLNVNNTDPARPLTWTGSAIYSGSAGGRALVIASGSAGNMVITGGTFDSRHGDSDVIVNGAFAGSLTINGGNYINTNGGSSIFLIGLNAGATTGAAPTLNIQNGNFTTGTLQFGQTTGIGAGGISGIVNLNGGVLAMNFISEQGTATTNGLTNSTSITSTFNFNGGTLLARQAGTIMAVNALDNAVVQSGGAVIDTNNFNVTIAKGLTAGSPSGGLTKQGAGTLTLSAATSYTGNTTISGGTLEMTGSFIESSPVIFIGDGARLKNTAGSITLQDGKSIVGTGATGFVETSSSATTNVTFLGNNTISNNNSGTLTLNRLDVFGTDNQITAGSIVSGFTNTRGLVIGNGNSGTLTVTGGSFTSNNGSSQADVLGNGAAGDGTLIINGGSYTTAQTLSLGLNTSASGTLTLANGSAHIGTLLYNAANSGGSGIVNLNGGSMTINTITSTSGATRQFNFNGGQFIASGNTSFANTLTLNVQDGGAKINTNGNNVSISGNLVNNGSGGLTKSGAGTLTLSGANGYTGDTNVSGGKLVVGGSIGASAVTVSGADTILATDAAATFGSTVNVQNGAILAPGDAGAAGTATVTGATTFDNGSIFSWDISANGTAYDKIVAPSLAGEPAAGDAVFRVVVADNTFADSFWNTTKTWTDIFTTDGSAAILNWADLFTVSVVNSDFSPLTLPGAASFTISGNTLTWTAVPEPTTALAGLLLTAGLLRRRRN